MRRLKLLILSVSLLTLSTSAQPIAYQGATQVKFFPLPSVKSKSGPKVSLVAGYTLKGFGTSRFEGISDLVAWPMAQGVHIEAVSDFGDHIRFDLIPKDSGLADSPLRVTPLSNSEGLPFGNKTMSDAEDMAHDPLTGDTYVSFEGEARIMVYKAGKDRGVTLPLQALPAVPNNQGLEAMTFIREFPGVTSLLIGAESGGFWQCTLEDYSCRQVVGPTTPGLGYALVSLAPLDVDKPDEILALYRYYTPWEGARSLLRRLKLRGNRLSVTETILKIKPPFQADNYEGVSAIKTENGYRLFLISDPIGRDAKTHLIMFDYKP
jgi:hypothetical protein